MFRSLPILLIAAVVPFRASVPSPQDYLSRLESEIIQEHNLARQSPREYAEHLEELARSFDGPLIKLPGKTAIRTTEGVRAVDEAVDFLTDAAAVGAIRPSRGLSRAATEHVLDQGPIGATGHDGTDGSKPWDRASRFGTWQETVGENIAFGWYEDDSARFVVMQLLIDDGVPGRGHRANIFNPEFGVAGVACGAHATYPVMCVIVYAGGYVEGENPP